MILFMHYRVTSECQLLLAELCPSLSPPTPGMAERGRLLKRTSFHSRIFLKMNSDALLTQLGPFLALSDGNNSWNLQTGQL